jgi:ribonuclease R
VVPTLHLMRTLADILFTKRKARGNIDFDLPESGIVLDDAGRAVDVVRRERLISHRMIEEFMLAANETVAEKFAKMKNVPFVYRAHENPPSEKLESLTDFLKALGITFPGNAETPHPADFNALLESVRGGAYETAVSKIALRTMSKAVYSPENKGHFGLAAPFYCHFTSPIRRYPDLAIHRIIKDFLQNGAAGLKKYGGFAVGAAAQSSERERSAEKAERDVDDLKKAEYMSDKIGNRYTGVIGGVTEWGVFVELPNTVEGMIRAENLPGDGYEHDRRGARLYNGVKSYRIGDTVEIEVAGVNGLKVEFKLAE